MTLIEGDLNNPADVENAIKGQDMVFNAVIDHDDGHNRPTHNILTAMQKNGVLRLILTNLLGIYDEVPGAFGKWNREVCFGGVVRADAAPVVSDQLAAKSGHVAVALA